MKSTKKDYYEILGVSRDADDKEIKAAYRRLARKYHPDVNPGDDNAEETFKQIAEAFSVLSNKEKREKYDRGGHAAFGPDFDPFGGAGFDIRDFDFGNLSDLFGIFGGGRTSGPGGQRPRRGQDLWLQVRIPFLQAARGTTLDLNLPRQTECSDCGGSGITPGSSESTCSDCGGTGRRTQRRLGLQVAMPCPTCQGAGRLPGPRCGSCGGSGTAGVQERVKVRIPTGVESDDKVRVPGKGHAGTAGGPPGDAYLIVEVEPHPLFRRDGRDLLVDVPVGITMATLGGNVEVPTLDGKTRISVPAGTRSGQKLRLKGKGIPGAGSRSAGDLFAVIQIHPPKDLDDKSRALLEEFARLNP